MKNLFTLIFVLLISVSYAQVLVDTDNTGYDTDTSAALEVRSATKGFLVPRMDTAPTNPVDGLIYYNTAEKCFKSYKESAWHTMGNNACLPAPVASNVAINGDLNVSSSVIGSYDYFDANGDAESGSTYQWQTNLFGFIPSNIGGQTNLNFDVVSDYEGEQIRFCVTPSDGTYFGAQACSDWQVVGPYLPPVNRINELNYNPSGIDSGEFVEVRLELGKDASNMKLTLYDGNNGNFYDEFALNTATTISSDATYTYYVVPTPGIQNGADGVALSDNGTLIEFISYGGGFEANNGDAEGKNSIDTNAIQTNDNTLQRSEDGTVWATSPSTAGAENVYVQPQTKVRFTRYAETVLESDGSVVLTLNIIDPDSTNDTTVDVELISGDATDLGSYTTQSVTFPAGDSTPKTITVSISDDVDLVSEDYQFSLTNVSGGNNATTTVPSSFLLTVIDDDAIPVNNQMVITGVVDGDLTGGLPKMVELYVLEDITDLTVYGIGSANNGDGTDGMEFNFPVGSSATAGDYIYIASETTQFTNFFGFAPDYTSSAISVNGDDAIELFKANVAIDIFGAVTTDGSVQPWNYKDGWAYSSNARQPSAVFQISDWTVEKAALNGVNTNSAATTPFPIGTYQP